MAKPYSDSSKKDLASVDEWEWQGGLPTKITVGDRIRLQLPNRKQELFALKLEDEQFKDSAVLVREVPGPVLTLDLIAIKPGKASVPEIVLLERGSGKEVARTIKMSFEVGGIQTSQVSPPPEFIPPVSMPYPWLWLSGVGLCLALVIGLIVFWLYRWSRKKPQELPIEPVVEIRPSAYEKALAKLEEIEKRRWMYAGEYKRHYFGISETFKEFLGIELGFDAKECTTSELLLELKRVRLPNSAIQLIREIFEQMDQVKFTDSTPTSEEGMEMLRKIRKHIGQFSGKLGEGDRQ